MNYYNKLVKYQLKNSLFKGGNKIDTIKDMFNIFFGNSWILTGSEAIQMYLNHFNITGFDFKTSDVDIFYVSKDQITSRTIGEFTRKQDQPETSMTFENKNDNTSFDVTIMKNSKNYYEINNIKLDTPDNMLENYEENLEFRQNPYDLIKINALKKILEVINPNDKKRLEIVADSEDNKRKRYDDDDEGVRLRFTDIPLEHEPERNLRQKLSLDDL
jgi:hypothetical protein